MIKHYLKHAYKFILRDKFHSFLNIFGLSIGITISIITFLFVQNELNYDSYHKKADRIYLYGVHMTIGDISDAQQMCTRAAGPIIKQNIPGIETFVRFGETGENLVVANNKRVYEEDFLYADEDMFKVFTSKFYSGNAETCLKEPNTIVLTKNTALKYFNKLDPIGEIVEVGDIGLFTVTAVVDDVPNNSIVDYGALLSFSTVYKNSDVKSDQLTDLGSRMGYILYFLFEEGTTEDDFYQSFQRFYDEKIKGTGYAAERIKYVPVLDKLETYHLNSKIDWEIAKQNKQFFLSSIYIGIFILLLACINYINMATSRAGMRAKEIALKKVLGSYRHQIAFQLFGESFLTTLIAFVFAFGFSEYILEFTSFNDLIGKDLHLNTFDNPMLVISSLIILVLISFVSGFYPAIYISGLKPIRALKEQKTSGSSKSLLRNALIVIQFTISIMVITVAFLMNSQLQFALNKDLGFKKDNVLMIYVRDNGLKEKVGGLKNELKNYAGINAVSFSYSAPAKNVMGYAFEWENKNGVMESHALRQMVVDKDFYPTLGIEVVAGRNFYRDTEISENDADMIVNQAMVDFMGWEDPIGKKSSYGKVIGVVEDFNFYSLYSEIQPMYSLKPFGGFQPEIIIVNMSGYNFHETMDYIEKKWYEFAPNHPFNYSFLEHDIAEFYEQDQQQKKLSNIFSFLCILISCLGLFGLTSFITLKRKKEVAIRKTYGAGINQIISTLFKNVLILIIIAGIFASPIAYWIYKIWIDNFVFHVKLNYLIFIWVNLGAILLAFIISLYHYIKVINSNVIDSLRYE